MRAPGILVCLLLCAIACGGGGGGAPDAAPAALQVAITTPADGATQLGSRTITVTGTLSSGDPITGVTIAVGAGAPAAATFDATSFTGSALLGDGDNVVTVTATTARDTRTATARVRFPYVALTTFQPATLVLGQPDFTHKDEPTTPDATRTGFIYGDPTWIGGTLYVPGSDYNRVLGWRGFPARDDEPADLVLGQTDFAGRTAGSGVDGMGFPQTAETDGTHLFVLDYDNTRVLGYTAPPTTDHAAADFVIGQSSLTLAMPVTGCARDQANGIDEISISGGKLFVGDTSNNRLLVWNTVPTTSGVAPDLVLGQGDFTHCTANDDNQDGTADTTPSARTMNQPEGAWTDGTRLFVADDGNNRVLVWNTFPTQSFAPADFVLGQADLTSNVPGSGATMFAPFKVLSNGNQLVVDEPQNSIVMIWNTIPTAATPPDVVLGQSDTTHTVTDDDNQDNVDDGMPSPRTLAHPTGAAFVRDALVVSDSDNNRVLVFGPLPCPSGQYEPPGQIGTCVADPCQPNPCTGTQLCRNDTGAAVCN